MHKILIFSILASVSQLSAQCVQGNCDNGWGRFKDEKGRIYEGHFLNGQKHGKGTFFYSNGDRYEGDWGNGLPNGYGIRFLPDGSATGGIWENGSLTKPDAAIRSALECVSGNCKTGQGKSRDAKGRTYEGGFKNGVYDGYGVLYYSNGDYYKGLFHKGLPHGKGSYYYQSGHVDTGDWENGKFKSSRLRVWALVAGVASYPAGSMQPLTFTTNDAKKIYGFLRSPEGGAVPEHNIKLLLDKDATMANIQNELAEIAEKADSTDLIIFYFAGHGVDGAFVPYDFVKASNENLLQHAAVTSILMDSRAKFKLCVADACHSGSFLISYNDYRQNGNQLPATATASRTLDLRDQIKEYYNSFANVRGGLAIIMSSAAEEVSLEATKLKQGVFSYFFMMGLRGAADENENGIVTIDELYSYINKQVRNYTFSYQTPEIFGDYDKNMPVGLSSKK